MVQSSQSIPKSACIAAVASVFWFALILQLVLSLQLSHGRGDGTLRGIWVYLGFFTITTNLLAAFALTLPLIVPRARPGSFFTRPATITAVAAYMLLVGIAYNLLLRNVWQPQGWQLVADVLLHDVNPFLFAGYWWLRGRCPFVRYAAIGGWTIYPLAYFAYAVARGLGGDFYAYPFIDVGALGFERVLLNALAIAAGFVIAAALLIAIGRRAPARRPT